MVGFYCPELNLMMILTRFTNPTRIQCPVIPMDVGLTPDDGWSSGGYILINNTWPANRSITDGKHLTN